MEAIARVSHCALVSIASLLLLTLVFLGASVQLNKSWSGAPVQHAHVANRIDNWNTLPSRRTLVVQFVSIERLAEFNRFWKNHETHFIVAMKNVSMLLACPYVDEPVVSKHIVEAHNWTLVKRFNHFHRLTHGPLSLFRTGRGVEVLLQPIIVTLPHYFMENPTVPTCSGGNWTLSYAMYSGAVFSYHLIQLPLLEKYDVFVKVDTDIEFKERFPVDIGQDMIERRCHVGHTAIHRSSDCERGSLRALETATKDRQLSKPHSIGYEWCNKRLAGDQIDKLFYGNLLAFSTDVLLHPEIRILSQYLFDEWRDGYFVSRWGDQAPFSLYACHILNIPNIHNDTQVCDYAKYRNIAFVHH